MGYDPDWPSKGETNEPERLTFWQFLVGFVLLEVVIWAAAAFCSGCASVDPAVAYGIYTNVVSHVPGSAEPDVPGGASSGGSAEPASSEQPAQEANAAPVLDFRFGGIKAKDPQEDPRCRISKLKIGSDSLSFKWESGIPGDWKRGDTKKGPMIVACAFYESGGRWIGGKFDWIDENRSSRSLENIHGGYGGWDAGAWRAAKKRAFAVVSADGKYRSNLLED